MSFANDVCFPFTILVCLPLLLASCSLGCVETESHFFRMLNASLPLSFHTARFLCIMYPEISIYMTRCCHNMQPCGSPSCLLSKGPSIWESLDLFLPTLWSCSLLRGCVHCMQVEKKVAYENSEMPTALLENENRQMNQEPLPRDLLIT